jgi:hypothetical protein
VQGNYFSINQIDENTFERVHEYVRNRIKHFVDEGKPCYVKVEEYKNPRSLSANSLYWVWMDDLAKLFNKKGLQIQGEEGERAYEKDDCHDLMRSMFLGKEVKTLSKTKIERLKSTRKLNSSEFCHYLSQIEHWSIDKLRHTLPNPADSAYMKWMEEQNQC